MVFRWRDEITILFGSLAYIGHATSKQVCPRQFSEDAEKSQPISGSLHILGDKVRRPYLELQVDQTARALLRHLRCSHELSGSGGGCVSTIQNLPSCMAQAGQC